jgi:hypothetical protein
MFPKSASALDIHDRKSSIGVSCKPKLHLIALLHHLLTRPLLTAPLSKTLLMRSLNCLNILPFRQSLTLQNMFRHHRALLTLDIIRILDMVDPQVVKARYTDSVEEQYTARLREKRDLDGVEAETDGFSGAEDAAEDADVVR